MIFVQFVLILPRYEQDLFHCVHLRTDYKMKLRQQKQVVIHSCTSSLYLLQNIKGSFAANRFSFSSTCLERKKKKQQQLQTNGKQIKNELKCERIRNKMQFIFQFFYLHRTRNVTGLLVPFPSVLAARHV